jgi:protein SCO1/2
LASGKLAFIALLLVACVAPSQNLHVASATVSAAPAPGLFTDLWRDEHDHGVSLSEWRGEPLVLSMIFRSCRARCPMTLHKLRRVEAAFQRQGRPVNFVLVTLDPQQDTPARLLSFEQGEGLNSASWHLLSGPVEQTRRLARFLRLHAAQDDFHIDHEVKTAIFDARGRLVLSVQGWSYDDDEPLQAVSPR